MFWRKRGAEKPPSPAPIEFRKTDDYRTRASNIWLALGFANDRLGMIDRIAGYLEIYAEMDRMNKIVSPPGDPIA